jgi:DNA-binding winged helix-turn-helix (wHTH) protein
VLSVLVEHSDRVIGRRELARRAGLADLSERRCDSILVHLRRALGPTSIITVRRRGWMLSPPSVATAATLLAGDGLTADTPLVHDDFLERGERAS